MLFSEIIGQEEVKNKLRSFVETGRIPHAILLHGKEGTGKLPLCIAFAQYLCCQHKTNGNACGKCPSCQQIAKLSHPDLHFVFPFSKGKAATCDALMETWRENFIGHKGYFTFDQWSNLLGDKQLTIYTSEGSEILRKLSLKSYAADFRIMIIWQPEKMQTECANRILKTLEEPGERTIFLLVSEHPELMLTTILSRTQQIAVPVIGDEELKRQLTTEFNVESDSEADELVRISGGSYTALLENIENENTNNENFELFVHIMRLTYKRSIAEIREWTELVCKKGRPEQLQFLQYAQKMIRESFMYNFHQKELNYLTQKESQFLVRFAPFIHETNVYGLMDELTLAEQHIAQNVNSKMVFFDLACRIMILIKKKRE